jgi:hypothetical protein
VIPLLVWLHRYSPLVHEQPVPKVSGLYSTQWQIGSVFLLVAGIAVAATSLLGQTVSGLRAGLILFGAGFLLFEANMVRIYRHLWLRDGQEENG